MRSGDTFLAKTRCGTPAVLPTLGGLVSNLRARRLSPERRKSGRPAPRTGDSRLSAGNRAARGPEQATLA
jgi:hypothetical protein